MNYEKMDYDLKSELRINLKSCSNEKKILLLEQDKKKRHQYLASLIKANNNARRGLPAAVKMISMTYPDEILIEQFVKMGGEVIEARNFKTNLIYSSPWGKDVEFIKNPKSDVFASLLRELKTEAQLFYPQKVYNKLKNFESQMSDSQKERFSLYPECVKMSFFPRQILIRFFASQLGLGSEVALTTMLDKYLDLESSPSLASFIWFLMQNNYEHLAIRLSDIANSPLKETFFNLTPTEHEGHALFIANHPDHKINQFLLTSFIQDCKGEFVSNNCDNYFFMDERFSETGSLLQEQMSRIFPRSDHHRLTVVFSSSFIPGESEVKQLEKALLHNELTYLMDSLIVGQLHDYTALSSLPYPEAISSENKKALSRGEKLLIFLREGTSFRRL